ncbi:unnamed protein product [Heligmosomoides polygyrus]|uniref:Uncharacterized protein n=1 Tax=Heligmosomoides polygyrus TaxID=6339 RepID=A0A183FSY6_HELPZ|nr:unnamed protein product [Heligmosomoides polygyrus]
MSLSSDTQTEDIDACDVATILHDVATILHYVSPKLDGMKHEDHDGGALSWYENTAGAQCTALALHI